MQSLISSFEKIINIEHDLGHEFVRQRIPIVAPAGKLSKTDPYNRTPVPILLLKSDLLRTRNDTTYVAYASGWDNIRQSLVRKFQILFDINVILDLGEN